MILVMIMVINDDYGYRDDHGGGGNDNINTDDTDDNGGDGNDNIDDT